MFYRRAICPRADPEQVACGVDAVAASGTLDSYAWPGGQPPTFGGYKGR